MDSGREALGRWGIGAFKIEGTEILRGAHRGLRLKVQGSIRGVLLRREQGTESRAQGGGISLVTRRKAEEINGK